MKAREIDEGIVQRGRRLLEELRRERERSEASRQALQAAIESLKRDGNRKEPSETEYHRGNCPSSNAEQQAIQTIDSGKETLPGETMVSDRNGAMVQMKSEGKVVEPIVYHGSNGTIVQDESLEATVPVQQAAETIIQEKPMENETMASFEDPMIDETKKDVEAETMVQDETMLQDETIIQEKPMENETMASFEDPMIDETKKDVEAETMVQDETMLQDETMVQGQDGVMSLGFEPQTLKSKVNLPLEVNQKPSMDVTISIIRSPKRSLSLPLEESSISYDSSLNSSSSSNSCFPMKKRKLLQEHREHVGDHVQDQEHEQKCDEKFMFSGMRALFVTGGEREARIQIWKNKFQAFGGVACDVRKPVSNLTHVFAANFKVLEALPSKLKPENLCPLSYHWVQECLMAGHLVSTGQYELRSVPDPPEILDAPKSLEKTGNDDDDEHEEVQAAEGAKEHQEEYLSSDEDEKSLDLAALRKRKRSFYAKQEGPNLNKHLTDFLAEMWHLHEDVLGNEFRCRAFRRACNTLQSLPFKVRYAEDVAGMNGIGKSLLQCIREILGTGRLQKLEELSSQPEIVTIQKFASVWGIGALQARQYFKKGYTSFEDLSRDASLSSMARLGLKYYDDMKIRIPREEVARVEKYVRDVVHAFSPEAWVNVAGSYRRGAADCGDIDILITHPDGSSHHGLLAEILQRLRSSNFIVDGTDACSKDVSKGGNQPDIFLGICQLQGCPFRRIDFKVYPRNVYAFALLAFTGNDVLNRKIRFLARMKGYKLSDQGLFVRESRRKGALASTESLVCETEKDIFEKLGLECPEPEQRNW